MVLERSVSPLELKRLQDDYSVNMASEGSEERRRGLMVIKKSSLPSKADKRKTAILNWQVCLDLKKNSDNKFSWQNAFDMYFLFWKYAGRFLRAFYYDIGRCLVLFLWRDSDVSLYHSDKCLSPFSRFNKFTWSAPSKYNWRVSYIVPSSP